MARWLLQGTRSLLDVAGVVLMGVLLHRIATSTQQWYDTLGALVAAAGVLGALLSDRSVFRTALNAPLAVYLVFSLISAWSNYHRYPPQLPAEGGEYAKLWQPAVHTVTLAAYFYAARWLLRTHDRMAAFGVLFVAVVSAFGTATSLESLSRGFADRYSEFGGLSHWAGYAPLAFLCLLAVPFPLAVAVASRSWLSRLASLLVAAMLTLHLVILTSKGAYLALAVVVVVMVVTGVRRVKLAHLAAFVLVVLVAAVSAKRMTSETLLGTAREFTSGAYSSRPAIWLRSLRLIRDHPLLGVGVGNYRAALHDGYVLRPEPYDGHAHNMLLHTAAERGIPAALGFAAIWVLLFVALWTACRARPPSHLLVLGVFGTLVAFFVRSLSDQFLSVFSVSGKLDYLLWTLFAVAANVSGRQIAGSAARDAAEPAR